LILDTNALSAAANADPAIDRVFASARQLALPVPVIGEYRYGIAQARRGVRHRAWLENFMADCVILDITDNTTHHYAAIRLELRRVGRPIPTNDIWIAALCRQHNFPLLSRDRHFDVVPGVQRIEW
jgi:predicted nucleic acid-binding protein